MAEVIPIILPCTQFSDTECEVWFSLATAAKYSFPNCEDIFFPDVSPLADDRLEKALDDIIQGNKQTMEVATNSFSLNYDDRSDTSVDEHEENNDFTGFSPLQNAVSNPFVSDEDEDEEEKADVDDAEEEDEDYDADFPSPDETFNALVAYAKAFPDGHEIIPTPATGFLCGFNAVIRSMKAMHPYLPCPTLEGLQEVFRSPAFVEHASAFGMTNEDNCKLAPNLRSWKVGHADLMSF